MKQPLSLLPAALAAIALAALPMGAMADSACTVTVTKFHQSYPFSGKATVEYTVGGTLPTNTVAEIAIAAGGAGATFVQSNIVAGAYTNVIDFASPFGGALVLLNASFTVTIIPGDDDLGGIRLWAGGPYWAECNVGASEPEEYGYYFWWGDTVGYTPSGGTWKGSYYEDVTWVSSAGQQMDSYLFYYVECPTWLKNYSTLQSEGWIDATGNLVAAHDAATAHLGDPWRMPTDAEFSALIENCTTTWIATNGVSGRLVTGKGAYADKSIFLPAAGFGACYDYRSNFDSPGSDGYYWSSTPKSLGSEYAWCLFFISSVVDRRELSRNYGLPVRPIRGFPGCSAGGAVTFDPAPIVIGSVADWDALSAAVAGGFETEGAVVRLACDVGPVATTVGTEEHPFAGVFDGGSNTLTVALSGSDYFLAPFSVVAGATIRDLRVAGTVAGGMHCSGLVGKVAGGASNLVEGCEVAAAISSSGSHFGGVIGHSVTNAATLRGCVFSGSISGGTYVATFHGWSDDGATTTLVDCLDASASDQPIGRGTDAACVSNTLYVASKNFNGERLWSEGKRGKRAYAVTEGEGVAIDFGAPAATYAKTGLAAYSPGLAYDGTFYAGVGDTVRLDLAAPPPSGMVLSTYAASAGTLSQSGSAWTLAMPDGPVVVSANWTPDITRNRVQLWKGGPYWAECNVGASQPWESGYYFWWGDTVGYARSGGTWDEDSELYEGVTWVSSTGQPMGSSPFDGDSCPTSGKDDPGLRSEGWIDATGNLAPEHDAATAHLGASWRMPTDAELSALVSNCDWTWTTKNGVNGYEVRGRGDYASNCIFLPVAGYGGGSDLVSSGSLGFYRSSTPYSGNSFNTWYLDFYRGHFSLSGNDYYGGRYYGQSVRPVFAPIDLSALTADYTAEDGDVLMGETAYTVTVPGGATVTVNGLRIAGGGTVNPAPAFASGGEAATTKFEKGEGDTWAITAFAELGNDALGTDVADEQIKVYRGDTADGVTNAVVPTITGKKSAVKVEMTVDAPSSAPAQFFRVGFGE